jgi:hypothetical protein
LAIAFLYVRLGSTRSRPRRRRPRRQATPSTARTASMRGRRPARKDRRRRVRTDRERIMGARVDPVCARSQAGAAGQRFTNRADNCRHRSVPDLRK